jgi:hypothetical protein
MKNTSTHINQKTNKRSRSPAPTGTESAPQSLDTTTALPLWYTSAQFVVTEKADSYRSRWLIHASPSLKDIFS